MIQYGDLQVSPVVVVGAIAAVVAGVAVWIHSRIISIVDPNVGDPIDMAPFLPGLRKIEKRRRMSLIVPIGGMAALFVDAKTCSIWALHMAIHGRASA